MIKLETREKKTSVYFSRYSHLVAEWINALGSQPDDASSICCNGINIIYDFMPVYAQKKKFFWVMTLLNFDNTFYSDIKNLFHTDVLL